MNQWENMLVHPETRQKLRVENETAVDQDHNVIASRSDGIWSFLDLPDEFYEGAYLNRTRHLPKKDNWLGRLPFFFVTNGYTWEVCKNFEPGGTLLELGCAGGIDFLAQRYNMIGLDLSRTSLAGMGDYNLKLQASADRIPLPDNSIDGVISSYFWEHMPAPVKDSILTDLSRILRPGGKLVFLYDIETENGLISKARSAGRDQYVRDFIDHDGHLGYETADQNDRRFQEHGFKVLRQIGMERTWLQSASAYSKLAKFPGLASTVGKIGQRLSSGRLGYLANVFSVRTVDVTLGRLWPINNSRILMTVAQLDKTDGSAT